MLLELSTRPPSNLAAPPRTEIVAKAVFFALAAVLENDFSACSFLVNRPR